MALDITLVDVANKAASSSAAIVTLIAAAIGAILALPGASLTNRANERRAREQLEHDRKERISEFRREVYAEAAEAISDGVRALGSFLEPDFELNRANKTMASFLRTMSKVSLVGSPSTVSKSMDLTTTYGDLWMQNLADDLPMIPIRAELTAITTIVEERKLEAKRINTQMRSMVEAGTTTSQEVQWNALRFNLDAERAELNRINTEIGRLRGLQQDAIMDGGKRLSQRMVAASELQADFLDSLREDIGVNSALETIKEKMAEARARMFQRHAELIHRLRNEGGGDDSQ
jgi:hypothetical protein